LYSDIEETEVEWLIPGYLPMKPTLITGKAGSKKSWMAAHLAALASRGGKAWTGDEVARGGVVMVTPEDDPSDTMAGRLKALGADMTNILDLTKIKVNEVSLADTTTTTTFSLPRDFARLQQAIRYVSATLIVLDPIMSITGKTGNDEANCRDKIINPLTQMCDEMGVCCLMINHIRKGTYNEKNVETAIMGSFHNACRLSYIAQKDSAREGVSIIKQFKNNLGPESPPIEYRLVSGLNGKVDITFLKENEQDRVAKLTGTDKSALQKAIITLIYTKGYPITPSGVAQLLDVNASTVRVEMRRMLDRKQLRMTSYGNYEVNV
jgi:hypothetical protein